MHTEAKTGRLLASMPPSGVCALPDSVWWESGLLALGLRAAHRVGILECLQGLPVVQEGGPLWWAGGGGWCAEELCLLLLLLLFHHCYHNRKLLFSICPVPGQLIPLHTLHCFLTTAL